MNYLGKVVLAAMLVVYLGADSYAQQGVTAPAVEEQQAPADDQPQMIGRQYPPGWSISGAGDALAIWDSNPSSAETGDSDVGQRYMFRVDLSRRTRRSSYLATYIPSFTLYDRTRLLNSMTHALSQELSYRVSNSNDLSVSVDARKSPAYAGSALADSGLGVLLMAMTGVTGLDLLQDVRSVQTDITLDHTIDNRSSLNFTASGGVIQYRHTSSNAIAELFTRADSKTWSGAVSAGYQYRVDEHSVIGVQGSHSYFEFTAENSREQVDALTLRYSHEFQNRWGIALNAGPDLVEQKNAPLRPGLELSVEANRATGRSLLRAYAQRCYRPGLEAGSMMNWTGHLSYERALSRRWMGGVYANYEDSSFAARGLNGGVPNSNVYSAAGQIGYRLLRHVTWIANYGYFAQRGAITDNRYIRRQQILTGLSFEFDSFLRQ